MEVRDRRRLGKGLASLLGQPVQVEPATEPAALVLPDNREKTETEQLGKTDPVGEPAFQRLPVAAITPNRYQPRREIDPGALDRLAQSIRASGVMQPIAVRPIAGGGGARWELIAGERRWRAAQLAGLTHVPAVITNINDQDAAEWAVVENLQREDLNPIERAWAFRSLAETFAMPHKTIAERVGLDRSSVTNLIRLTELEPEIQSLIATGKLTAGHAKALLSLEPGPARVKLAQLAAEKGYTVRRLESIAAESTPSSAPTMHAAAVGHTDLERQLADHLGTRVRIRAASKGDKGRITVEYFSLDHFDALMTRFGFRYKS